MNTARALILVTCMLYGSNGMAADAGPGTERPLQGIAVSVRETAGLNGLRPVTGGVPILQGAAPDGTAFALFDTDGAAVPCQTKVLARWKDDSIRWLLLDFQADPPANGAEHFRLRWSKDADPTRPDVPVTVHDGSRPSIVSGRVSVRPTNSALCRIADRVDLKLTMTDRQGRQFAGVVEQLHVETEGDVRSTLVAKGALLTAEDKRAFGFRLRASVYASLGKVRLEPQLLIDADKGLFQDIRQLCLEVCPVSSDWTATIGGLGEANLRPSSAARLLQIDDQTLCVEGATKRKAKAPGWAQIADGKGTVAIAVKDFWQQWPKSLEIADHGLKIGLLPGFEPGAFAHMKPWYKYQYWFAEDHYRLRTGQAPRWVIWIDVAGDGPSLARNANAPLVPSADPTQAIATGVWGYIAPAGSPGMANYDHWA
ncbi:MAG: RIFT barrel domain-containing protein, partial [Planctomycetota bacterium]